MIVISGVILVDDSTRQQVLECLSTLKEKSCQDKGVAAYRFGIDIDNPNEIHVYEEWESTDDLKAHGKQPHMDAFRKLRQELEIQTTGFSRWRAETLGEF